jgi:hypothetical protein
MTAAGLLLGSQPGAGDVGFICGNNRYWSS